MYWLFSFLGLIAIFYLFEKWSQERVEHGLKLPNDAKPFYNKILLIVHPYNKTLNYVEGATSCARNRLDALYKEKSKFSIYLFSNKNDDFIVHCYALLYLYTFRPGTTLYSQESNTAESSIKLHCLKKLIEFGEDIPNEILAHFNTDLRSLTIDYERKK